MKTFNFYWKILFVCFFVQRFQMAQIFEHPPGTALNKLIADGYSLVLYVNNVQTVENDNNNYDDHFFVF